MRNKVYFISDSHLGSVSHLWKMSEEEEKTLREQGVDPLRHVVHNIERKMCRWLDMVSKDAKTIYLMGDILDYWFEYRNVVPRGFTRFLGKLSELSDMGIDLHFFIGNHDIWLTDYLEKECGMTIHRQAVTHTIFGKKFYLAHGDGLGDDSKSFMFLRMMFHSKFCRFVFAMIHPRFTVGFARSWSNSRRAVYKVMPYKGEANEPLVIFAKEELKRSPDLDYFIFGHRHIMLDLMLPNNARMGILGDWINYCSYAVFDGEKFSLEKFESEEV